MSASMNRRYVKTDAYAMFDLRREHRLSVMEWAMLTALTNLANHRSHEWTGTIAALSNEYTGAATKTIRVVLPALEDRGLIEIVQPFTRNANGTVRIVVYDELVVPERGESRGTNDLNGSGGSDGEQGLRRTAEEQPKNSRGTNDLNGPRNTRRNGGSRVREALRGEVGGSIDVLEHTRQFVERLQQHSPAGDTAIREVMNKLRIGDLETATAEQLQELGGALFDIEGELMIADEFNEPTEKAS